MNNYSLFTSPFLGARTPDDIVNIQIRAIQKQKIKRMTYDERKKAGYLNVR